MEKEILEQILAQQTMLVEEIRALKKEIDTLNLQIESLTKMQNNLYVMQERQTESLRKTVSTTQNIAKALEIKPEPTTEEIRRKIEIMDSSPPKQVTYQQGR